MLYFVRHRLCQLLDQMLHHPLIIQAQDGSSGLHLLSSRYFWPSGVLFFPGRSFQSCKPAYATPWKRTLCALAASLAYFVFFVKALSNSPCISLMYNSSVFL